MFYVVLTTGRGICHEVWLNIPSETPLKNCSFLCYQLLTADSFLVRGVTSLHLCKSTRTVAWLGLEDTAALELSSDSHSLFPPFHIDPGALRGGLMKILHLGLNAPKFLTLHVVQLWVFASSHLLQEDASLMMAG